ncbi:hypothetical protein BKH41_08815 [Helicobacter sp. 12S02232-10]|uniref:hypothetical protein n=1 Tax=Helicobacter sp. 12S02232-10 TaxID=1476197 RepID=UPI000BA631C0|nr:hypothetical protein [Helicobacter sp. 12S02232-10]PAF46596.1 hypothetical protein BKH41_08815 [Helicobacter sp. 12S02232-10]
MKKILVIFILGISICFGNCIDNGIMKKTASNSKSIYRASDKVLSNITLLVKTNMENSKKYNQDALRHLLNIQNLESHNAINAQKIFFNTKMINKLESVLIDNKAESLNFQINKELEEILR